MLKLTKISTLIPYSEEWFTHRLGYMTGSKISCIMGVRGIGDGGMTYIRNKVSERITGKTTERNINTEATIWGVNNEPLAVKYFQQVYNIPLIITDKHIVHDMNYSVTPDALLVMNEKLIYDATGESINCETLESKSYMTPAVHMEHIECKTASEIKVLNQQLFWQCIAQLYFCNTLKGHAIFFHPDFPENSKYRLGHVEFKKIDLLPDFKLFTTRLEEARDIFNKKIAYSNG